jgi:hypothetical protein
MMMMSNIHDDPEYKKIKSELDEKVRELASYVQQWGTHNGVGGKTGNLIVTGWLLPIAVTLINEDGEFDDLLQECNAGINTYMAVGISDATHDYWLDASQGLLDSEDD